MLTVPLVVDQMELVVWVVLLQGLVVDFVGATVEMAGWHDVGREDKKAQKQKC